METISSWSGVRRRSAVLAAALGLLVLLWPRHSLTGDNFVFYMPGGHQIVPVNTVNGVRYLPALQVMGLAGNVSVLQQKRNSLKAVLGGTEVDFHVGDAKVRVGKVQIELAQPVRILQGQLLVPLDFLTQVMPMLTPQRVRCEPGSGRAFIGNINPVTFTLRTEPAPNGIRVVVRFSDKVNVQTASTNGRWIIYLGGQPVEPLEPAFTFQSRYLSNVQFDDRDGVPKLILTPASPNLNLFPKLAEDQKVLMAEVIQPPPIAIQQSPVAPGAPGKPPGQPPGGLAPQTPPSPPPPPLPAVVVDPGHGGADAGARSRDGILEKDLVAGLADRVRNAPPITRRYRVVLTRAGDANPSFDERETKTNSERPIAFVTLHAGDLGETSPAVRLYVYPFESPATLSAPEEKVLPLFVPWAAAQQPHLEQSRVLAQAIRAQLAQVAGLTVADVEDAPVRQLRSVAAPAVAIELGTLRPASDAGVLTQPDFQQKLAEAIAQGILQFGSGG